MALNGEKLELVVNPYLDVDVAARGSIEAEMSHWDTDGLKILGALRGA